MRPIDAKPFRRIPDAHAFTRLPADEIADLRNEVQRLRRQLEHAQDRERRRIAREMHDSTVQDLVGLGLMLRRLDDMVTTPAAKTVLTEARDVLARTQQDLRTLSYLRHPPMLDERGLEVALRSLIRGLSCRMGIRIELKCDNPVPRASIELENELYRVVQEALINVQKHAAASFAAVRYFREDRWLVVEVEDDGTARVAGNMTMLDAGVGIQSMRARLEPFGGTLTVSSTGAGVLVRAEIRVVDFIRAAPAGEPLLVPAPRENGRAE